MNDTRLSLKLIPAADEPDFRDAHFQSEMEDVERAFQSSGMTVHSAAIVQKSIGGGSWLTGDFTVFAQTFGGAAFTILGVWLRSKLGRRIRVRVGDIEAEASTPDEVERLLEKAEEIRKRREPNS